MKKLLFLTFFLSTSAYADLNGSLFDPVTGDLLRVRVYFPSDELCVQINSANHICWSYPNSNFILLENGTYFLLEDGSKALLE